jgi:hypothetical protein
MTKISPSNRIQEEYKEGGNYFELCTSTIPDVLCSPYVLAFSSPALWKKCSILLAEISSDSI